jgi:hypothetical protein
MGTGTIKHSMARSDHAAKPSFESLYRTRWLAAHNRLHSLVHRDQPADSAELKLQLDAYLKELNSSEEIASRPA